jgi:hypothetical protein
MNDRSSGAFLGETKAYYINTPWLGEANKDLAVVSNICPTTRDLVALNIWEPPEKCEAAGHDPCENNGLIIQVLTINPSYRRRMLGKSKEISLVWQT